MVDRELQKIEKVVKEFGKHCMVVKRIEDALLLLKKEKTKLASVTGEARFNAPEVFDNTLSRKTIRAIFDLVDADLRHQIKKLRKGYSKKVVHAGTKLQNCIKNPWLI